MRVVFVVRWIIRVILVLIVGVLAFYNLTMLFERYILKEETPTFFGLSFAVVATGSMEPEIGIHDVIVTAAQDSYGVNDIVTYYDSAQGISVTHRIVREEDGVFYTKGDANNAEDPSPVQVGQIVGKVVSVWKNAGAAVQFLQSPMGLFAVLAAGIVIWLVVDLSAGAWKKERAAKNENQEEEKKESQDD